MENGFWEGGSPALGTDANLERKLPATRTQQGNVMNTFIYKYN